VPDDAAAPIAAAPAPTVAGSPAAGQLGTGPAAAPVRRDSTVNYEVDKTIRHTRQQVGVIKRLSVAVVVNHRKTVDAEGKVTSQALSADEMTQINALVKEVMGYNKERGDSLNVANSAFSASEIEPIAEVPLWKQPDNIAMAKEVGRNMLIAGLVLFLVLGVLRPLLTKLSEPRLVAASPGAPNADAGASQQRRAGYEENLNAAKQLARSEPMLVANVVKEWVAGNE